MDVEFWHERWKRKEIGFHREKVHPFLQRFFSELQLSAATQVLVPLCGKSVDLLWLREQGYQVAGVELSSLAVEEFWGENNLQPKISRVGDLQLYQQGQLKVYCGDFFALTPEQVGPIAAIYDRAALVALPPEMRLVYARHLCSFLQKGQQILTISFDYLQQQMTGPPFSVPQTELKGLFNGYCSVEQLHTQDTLDKHPQLKTAGITELREEVYRLKVL